MSLHNPSAEIRPAEELLAGIVYETEGSDYEVRNQLATNSAVIPDILVQLCLRLDKLIELEESKRHVCSADCGIGL